MISVPELIQSVSQSVRKLDAASGIEECSQINGLLIDVREPAEAQALPTKSTAVIPRGVLEMKIGELASDPAHPIYLHCAAGARAILAAEQLQRLGYTNVTAIAASANEIAALG